MKKYIIIIAFLLVIFTPNVNADKVYTKKYYLEGENPKEYPYKSEAIKTIIYQTKEKKEEHKDRVLIKESEYIYKSLSFRYIAINGFDFAIKPHLSEVELLKNNEIIKYTYQCTYCYGVALTNLNNGKYYADVDRATYMDFTMLIDLGEIYNPEEVMIIMYFTNPLKEIINTKYNIWYLKDKPSEINRETIFENAVIHQKVFSLNENTQEKYTSFLIKSTENEIKTKIYDNTIQTTEEKSNNFYKLISNPTYTYKEKLYKYYKIKKEKINLVTENNKTNKNTNEKHKNIVVINNQNDNTYPKKQKVKEKNKNITIRMSSENMLDLSNNINEKKSYIDIKTPLLFGIVLLQILLMVYVMYKLKKEK